MTTVAAIEELFVEQKRIAGRGRLATAARTALAAVYEEDGASAHDLLAKASAALRSVADLDPATRPEPAQLLSEATIIAREAAEVSAALSGRARDGPGAPGADRAACRSARSARSQAPPERLELPAQMARTEAEIEALANAELSLADLELKLADLTRDYAVAAERLSAGAQAPQPP